MIFNDIFYLTNLSKYYCFDPYSIKKFALFFILNLNSDVCFIFIGHLYLDLACFKHSFTELLVLLNSTGNLVWMDPKGRFSHFVKAQPLFRSDQIRSVAQSCPTLCDPMNRSMPGLPVRHQLPEFTETHIHRVSDAIQPSHPLSSPSPLAPNPSINLTQMIDLLVYLLFQLKHLSISSFRNGRSGVFQVRILYEEALGFSAYLFHMIDLFLCHWCKNLSGMIYELQ